MANQERKIVTCTCCPVVIEYAENRGKPVDVFVKPYDLLKTARVQRAIHMLDADQLTQDCKECKGQCAGKVVIAEFKK